MSQKEDPIYVIGLDIGTTSTKAMIFTPTGDVVARHAVDYPLLLPKPSWVEQRPDQIFEAVIVALREVIARSGVDAKHIAAVGLSAAMHSLIAVDRDGAPLTNSMTWADSRSIEQVRKIKKYYDTVKLYVKTGTPIHPMSPLSKLLWLREAEPDVFKKAAKFISIKEYIVYRLFGVYRVDQSIASSTGLLNITDKKWDEDILSLVDIRQDQLSEVVPTRYVLRGLAEPIARSTGLHPNTPFVIGGSDGALASLGVGAMRSDQLAVTVGTSGAVRAIVDQPRLDEEGRTFCYVLSDDLYVIGGPTNNGGIVLRWFIDEFGQSDVERAKDKGVDVYTVLSKHALSVPPGADGLLFLPFLAGERAPHWNAEARGLFFGIGIHHTRAHFIRAMLEGIVFELYGVAELIRRLSGDFYEVRVSGGVAQSGVWRQILADVFGSEVVVPKIHDSSSWGAALLAMYALGMICRLEDVSKHVELVFHHQPDLANARLYRNLYSLFEKVYHANIPIMSELRSAANTVDVGKRHGQAE